MMNRYIVRTFALVLVVALMGVVLLSCSQGSVQQSGQQSGSQTGAQAGAPADPTMTTTPGPKAAPFPGLEGIPPDQLFDHFLGAQYKMTDANDTPFTLNMIPGTVSSVISTSITITPTGQTATQTFNITPTTTIRAEPAPGTIQSIVPGDKVMIITRDTSMDAILVAKHGAAYHRRMMESMTMAY